MDGFISAHGRHLIRDGNPFVLRGINLSNWMLPEGYLLQFNGDPSFQQMNTGISELIGDVAAAKFWHDWRDAYIQVDDIKFIKDSGLNHVRLPFSWRLLVTADYPHRFEGPGWEMIDRAVRWCKDAGLYIILDLHAAPDGQTGAAKIDDSRGRPLLFESSEAMDLTVSLWVAIATRYRDAANVAGYELLNEPIADTFNSTRYNSLLGSFYRRLVAAIREVDNRHVIFLGGAQWNTNFEAIGEPFADNIAYTFHTYWADPVSTSIQKFVVGLT
jgi:endoglucanase